MKTVVHELVDSIIDKELASAEKFYAGGFEFRHSFMFGYLNELLCNMPDTPENREFLKKTLENIDG